MLIEEVTSKCLNSDPIRLRNWRREIKLVDPAAQIEVVGVGDGVCSEHVAARSPLDRLASCDGRLESLKLPFSEAALEWAKALYEGAILAGHPDVERAQPEMRHLEFEPRTMWVLR
jgi:hypothetical protein